MSRANSETQTNGPYEHDAFQVIKTLREAESIFTTTTRRQAAIDHKPQTAKKGVLTYISSVMMCSGFDRGKELLDGVQETLYETLVAIKESPEPLKTLEKAIELMEGGQMNKALSVHRTTVNAMLPKFTGQECNDMVEKNYLSSLQELASFRAQSKQITMCIDGTAETLHTKYPNGGYKYVHVGQKCTWEKGLNYESIYDGTHNLHMGVFHRGKSTKKAKKRMISSWLLDVQTKIQLVEQAGSVVANIEFDRGFFEPEAFALPYLGILAPDRPIGEQPRVIVPRKFGSNKAKYKWAYLLNPDSPQVFTAYIPLASSSQLGQMPECKAAFSKDEKGAFLVPYACVGLVDEYSRKSSRSLEEIHLEAAQVQKDIDDCAALKEEVEEAYLWIQELIGKRKLALPGYGRGRKRAKFDSAFEKELYTECFTLLKQQKVFKEKKRRLLNALTFICVSLRPGEDPLNCPKLFIALARDYHDRWVIEIGYESVKYKFRRDIRTRKPTTRHFSLAFGMAMANDWHVARTKGMLESYRKDAWNKVPWDPKRPWSRRRLEKELGACLTADSYLIQIWAKGMTFVIKNQIKAG